MKILLHICCAPCSIYPIDQLRAAGHDVMGFFYRSNIHPYTECIKRQQTLEKYAGDIGLKLIIAEAYDLESFIQNVAFREKNRCRYCYHHRLQTTAKLAKRGKFDGFCSTLLYSRYQDHEAIRSIGGALSKESGLPFFYDDYRIGWKQGIEASKQLGMYRQQYCGCIYSEKERFYKQPKS
jgi:predicted adenine nucleotide alpha hydrolase (AANH) superfamily ATPase